MKKLFYLAAAAAFALASCQPAPEEQPTEVTFPDAPEKVEEFITASPVGHAGEEVLTFDIEAEGAWTITPAEDYEWITVTPESGTGTTTVSFEVAANETAKERIAEYVVKESFVGSDKTSTKDYTTYIISISQSKPESNLADGTYTFLKQFIDGKMLGDKTPTVDNWYNFTTQIEGIGLVAVDGGKYEIQIIDFTRSTDLCGFPTELVLPELESMNINECPGLEGKELPKVWNTPKLVYCNIAASGLTGVLPDGFASSTPKLQTVYFNGNNFYGALPHVWAAGANGGTGVLECFIGTTNKNNVSVDTELPLVHEGENPGLGYMVPATCDVKLNKWNNDDPSQGHANPSRDLTQMKLGGCTELNYVGFEAGWGQERYVKYGDGLADDLNTWSDHRLLVDEWQSYFSNLGYTDMAVTVPHVMLTWDQAAADAYTKEAKAKWGK